MDMSWLLVGSIGVGLAKFEETLSEHSTKDSELPNADSGLKTKAGTVSS